MTIGGTTQHKWVPLYNVSMIEHNVSMAEYNVYITFLC